MVNLGTKSGRGESHYNVRQTCKLIMVFTCRKGKQNYRSQAKEKLSILIGEYFI